MYIGIAIKTRSPLPENFQATLTKQSTMPMVLAPDIEVEIGDTDIANAQRISVYGVNNHTTLSGFARALQEANIEPVWMEIYEDADKDWSEGQWLPCAPEALWDFT